MTAVVDSSFIIAALIREEHSPFVRQRLPELMAVGLLAPALLAWEVTNVLLSKQRRGFIGPRERAEMVTSFEGFSIELEPVEIETMNRMLNLADRHGLTAYDAAYLELALSKAAELASLDDDLVKAARAEGLTVHCPF